MPDPSVEDLLTSAEAAVAAGDPSAAREHLASAATLGIDDTVVSRYVATLTVANRLLSKQRETLAWIEARLAGPHGPAAHAALLRGRIGALRQIDTRAVLDLVDEAIEAARAVGDFEALASVLAHASFCAYRQGNGRLAAQMAALAAERSFPTAAAQLDALRARMFAATANGEVETSLALSREVRDEMLSRGDHASGANEMNNIAEALLILGLPDQAKVEAEDAVELGQESGHGAVATFAKVLVARSMAELGELDRAIELLRHEEVNVNNVMLALDAAAILSYWLVERDAPGDAAQATHVAALGVTGAEASGVTHCLTTLLATHARATLRAGDPTKAREFLARARVAADAADPISEQHLALTMAEVLDQGDPARDVALKTARAKLLRAAARREDPWSFCTRVRLNRRLLELSGGVPADLPRPAR